MCILVCTSSWCCQFKRNSKKKEDMSQKRKDRVDKVDEQGRKKKTRMSSFSLLNFPLPLHKGSTKVATGGLSNFNFLLSLVKLLPDEEDMQRVLVEMLDDTYLKL